MKQFGSGVSSLARRMPMNCAIVVLAVATNGTWMRFFSLFVGRGIICGELSIRTETYSISWSRATAIKRQPRDFFRKLLKGLQHAPRVIITDKLKSYGAAKREILPGVEHRQHKYLGHPSGELASTHTTA